MQKFISMVMIGVVMFVGVVSMFPQAVNFVDTTEEAAVEFAMIKEEMSQVAVRILPVTLEVLSAV